MNPAEGVWSLLRRAMANCVVADLPALVRILRHKLKEIHTARTCSTAVPPVWMWPGHAVAAGAGRPIRSRSVSVTPRRVGAGRFVPVRVGSCRCESLRVRRRGRTGRRMHRPCRPRRPAIRTAACRLPRRSPGGEGLRVWALRRPLGDHGAVHHPLGDHRHAAGAPPLLNRPAGHFATGLGTRRPRPGSRRRYRDKPRTFTKDLSGDDFRHAPVVRDVSLTIESGEAVGLLGPSGCGRSALARISALLHRPGAGTRLLDGEPVHHCRHRAPRAQRTAVGVVFQQPRLSAAPGYGSPTSSPSPCARTADGPKHPTRSPNSPPRWA